MGKRAKGMGKSKNGMSVRTPTNQHQSTPINTNQHQSTPINTNQHHPHCSHSPLSNKGGGGAVIGFHHDVASGGILQQDLHDRHLAHFTGNVQRCLDEKGAFRHVRTRFHQQLGAPGFSLFASNEQGCLARFAGRRRKRRGRRGRRGRRKKRKKRGQQNSHLLFLETPVATWAILVFFFSPKHFSFSKTFLQQQYAFSLPGKIQITFRSVGRRSKCTSVTVVAGCTGTAGGALLQQQFDDLRFAILRRQKQWRLPLSSGVATVDVRPDCWQRRDGEETERRTPRREDQTQ
jgi:hypothetical protein